MNEVRKRFCKSSLPAIVPTVCGLITAELPSHFPSATLRVPVQLVRPATSCYSNRIRAESRSTTALRHFLVSPLDRFFFPFLSFLFSSPFLPFSLSHFPRDKFETNATSHVFAEERLVPIGTRSKNRFAISFTGHVFHSRLPWRVGFGLID